MASVMNISDYCIRHVSLSRMPLTWNYCSRGALGIICALHRHRHTWGNRYISELWVQIKVHHDPIATVDALGTWNCCFNSYVSLLRPAYCQCLCEWVNCSLFNQFRLDFFFFQFCFVQFHSIDCSFQVFVYNWIDVWLFDQDKSVCVRILETKINK